MSFQRALRCCAHRVVICCRSFFKSYLQQLRHMVKEGFVSQEHVDHIIVESDVTKLLDRVPFLFDVDADWARLN